MAKGIDVSNNNGHVDWAAVAAAGYRYAMCKATEGLGFVDSFYTANRAGAHAHGLAFGAYHFFTPGEDARAQAEFFLKHATPKRGDIVPTLDYERPPAERAPAELFVAAIHNDIGHWPMFYSYLSFVQSMRVPASSPLARCPLWLADFTIARPASPAPWHEITIWQHSSSGRVPGIGGSVDLDAGTPPLEGPGPITHYEIHHLDKHHKHKISKTTTPILWQRVRPRVKRRGKVVQIPVRKHI
jgi:lysozyme